MLVPLHSLSGKPQKTFYSSLRDGYRFLERDTITIVSSVSNLTLCEPEGIFENRLVIYTDIVEFQIRSAVSDGKTN